MDHVAVGHGVAEEAGAEGNRAFGPLAPDWDSWTTSEGLTRQRAGGTCPLPSTSRTLATWRRADPSWKSWLSKALQRTQWSSQMQWICGVNKHLKRRALRNPRKVLYAKYGISGEPCEAGWLKAQSPWDGSQWAESQSSAGTCRSRAPWQNWPGKFVLLTILRIKKALRPPALSFLRTNKGTPTTIKLQNPFH